jgi:P-type Ca2+ transporter type 2C
MHPQEVLSFFRTDPTIGLSSSIVPTLRATHGYNEFSSSSSISAFRKIFDTIYGSPLNLLLLGSAAISVLVGNIDDAVSITISILIVLTGKS